jgi:hypothetical protein
MHFHRYRLVQSTIGAHYKECRCGKRKVVLLFPGGHTGIDRAWETDHSRKLPGLPSGAPLASLKPQIRPVSDPDQDADEFAAPILEVDKVAW